jgi:HK97 gp10 family phage protein
VYQNTLRGTQKAMWKVAKGIRTEFNKQVLAKDKTGVLYIRRTPGGYHKRHIASAPGETPANRTGYYRRSLKFDYSSGKHLGEVVVKNTAEYSGYLELGTRFMKARPGMSNAIKANNRNIIRDLYIDIESSL